MKLFPIILLFYVLPALAVTMPSIVDNKLGDSWDAVTLWADRIGLLESFHPFLKDAREMNWRCKQGKREATHFCQFVGLPDRVDEECMNIVDSSTCIDVDAFRILMNVDTLRIVRIYFPDTVRYWDLEALAAIKDKVYVTSSLLPLVDERMMRQEGLHNIDRRIKYLQSRGIVYTCIDYRVSGSDCGRLHPIDSAFLDFLRDNKKYNLQPVNN